MASRSWMMRIAAAAAVTLAAGLGATARADDNDSNTGPPKYPTAEFAEGARTTSVSAGGVTATITMERRAEINPDVDVPVLTVSVDGKQVAESVGIDDDTDDPAATASIVEMDPTNHRPEVYFSSYNGGCCSTVIVVEEVGDTWVSVPVGDLAGDEDYLDDLDGDGVAEIATIDSNFLDRFDCTACSAAPRVIYSVSAGKVVDLTTDKRFLQAHRDWLKAIEESVDPDARWTSRGYLAGWLAEEIRVGDGPAAWQELVSHWNFATDQGEEICPDGSDPDNCDKKDHKVLKFPDELKLFLTNSGYTF